MSIDAIMNQYRADKVPDIIKDYRQVKAKLGVETSNNADDTEAPWWSGNIAKEVHNKDYLCAKALTSLAILNGPTDLDDFFSAWKQIKSKFKENMQDGYDPKKAQHPFAFLRGTILHKYLNPNSEKCFDKKLAKKVIKEDVSLAETKFGKDIMKKINVKHVESINSNVESLLHTKEKPNYVKAFIYDSKNTFGDLTARALTRTPKLGVYTLSGLGAVHAGYEIAKGHNIFATATKTALEVGTTLTTVGYFGAIGYKHFGTVGSLIGMGLGTALGAIAPKLIPTANQEIL